MSDVGRSMSWRDELKSFFEDTGAMFPDDQLGISPPAMETKRSEFTVRDMADGESTEPESLKDQVKEFAKAWGEMFVELAKGVNDIVQQSILTDDSYLVLKFKGPMKRARSRLRFLNDYLPEDRDPVHSWSVIFCVFFVALAVLMVNTKHDHVVSLVKKISIHPPSATRMLLPDGRYLAYLEQGVSCSAARHHVIVPHSFLSSRVAGIPGVNASLLQEFGIHLVTYDLPGFGESDFHPKRNLSSSALDMFYLASSVGIKDKFWVLGFSSGAMHAWAALNYIPDQIRGAAMFSPMINPYESSMSKEEISKTWETWSRRRKMMHYFARRFPKFLSYIYRRSFLSGNHGRLDNWFSWTLGNKDKNLTEDPRFEELWHRDVEESIRQGNVDPFIQEAVLHVTDWGFKLTNIALRKKCPRKGLFAWFTHTEAECHWTGFQGPIHMWQGLDDQVVPASMFEYVGRVVPNIIVHKLPDEGHFSYFFLCDECHRQIFETLFGPPQGPLEMTFTDDETSSQLLDTAAEDDEDEGMGNFNATVATNEQSIKESFT